MERKLEVNVTAARIAYYLKLRGFTRNDLARRTGITESQLSRRQTNPDAYKLGELRIIAAVLGCKVCDLTGDK